MSDYRKIEAVTPQLELPFKPFTVDEVCDICGTDANTIEAFSTYLVYRMGEDKRTVGLEYNQCFAVFVAERYCREGAPQFMVYGVLEFLADVSVEHLQHELEEGNDWPVPPQPDRGVSGGIFVPSPRDSLGARLNLTKLSREFAAEVQRVFPNG